MDDLDDDEDDDEYESETCPSQDKKSFDLHDTILKCSSTRSTQPRRLSMQFNLLDTSSTSHLDDSAHSNPNSSAITPTNGQHFDLLNSTPLNFNSLDSIEQMHLDPFGLCAENSTFSNTMSFVDDDLNKTLSLDGSMNSFSALASQSNSKLTKPKDSIYRSSSMQTGTGKLAKNRSLLKNTASLNLSRNESLVDGLLGDIYDRFNASTLKEHQDSDVFTEFSASSARLSGDSLESENKYCAKNYKLARSHLQHMSKIQLALYFETKKKKKTLKTHCSIDDRCESADRLGQ